MALLGNGHNFRCGRQCAAWLGQVPGQYSSDGKPRLRRITEAGDPYLQTLLIQQGARSVLTAAPGKGDSVSRWALPVQARRGYFKAHVAIAARNARMAWAILRKGDAFLALPASERAEIAVALLDSLEAVDAAAVTNAWRGEIRQRKADILAGRAKLIPWNEARALILAL